MERPTAKPKNEATTRYLLLLATAVALALRLYNLTFQSLWWDEGISLYLSAQGLDALVFAKDFALDVHPPLYHVFLALWTAVVGHDVFTARAFSVALGVLNVPLLYLLVRRLATPMAGLIAAWLLAISPMHIFYSQEVRMYSLVPLLATLSLLTFVWLLTASTRRERVKATLGYVAVATIGLYSYYYLGLLLVAENLYFAARWLARRTDLRWWVGSQVAMLLLVAPWVLLLAGHMEQTDLLGAAGLPASADSLTSFVETFGLAFSVGFSVVEPWSRYFAALFLAVGLVGVGVGNRSSIGGRSLSLLWLAVPVLLAYAIATKRAFVFPRFVIFSALAAYALVGIGIAQLWRRAWPVGALVLVLLTASSGLGLFYQYSTPRTAYSSSDYLLFVDRLAAMARPSDLVLTNQAWGAGYARAYLPDPQPTLAWAKPEWSQNPALAKAEIGTLLAEHERVWLLDWAENGQWQAGAAEEQLAQMAQSRYVEQYGEFRLHLFAQEGLGDVQAPLGGRQGVFGQVIGLAGAEAQQSGPRLAGGRIDLTLAWHCLAPMERSYTVFTQLIGPDGKLYGQKDGPPLGGTRLTKSWQAGEMIVDRYGLEVD
ncbi:MAG: glycosyltransferase family 39 protein, partial [Chloroflexota bacterium]